MDLLTIILAVAGGFVAGLINTLAGSGSAITLTILSELFGLPGNVANATNRVGVFFQTASASLAFQKHGQFKAKQHWLIIVTMIIGALLGVYLALIISNEQFKVVFKYLLLLTLLIVLVKPKRWIEGQKALSISPLIRIPLYFLLGIYGGFIQMGMGIFALAVFVLMDGMNIIKANYVKTIVVAMYTLIVLAIFQYKGLIDWKFGGIIASGQLLGGWYTAKYASKNANAAIWAYRLLIAVILAAIIKVFNLWEYWPF